MRKNSRSETASTPNEVGISWEKFSPERVESARKGGTPLFIDFTAEWCINCKVNEGTVLNTAPVAAAFRDKKVVTLRADWTDFDPVIGEWLKRFKRIGVPLYVLYLPGQDTPILFPELLSQKLVIDAVSGASPN